MTTPPPSISPLDAPSTQKGGMGGPAGCLAWDGGRLDDLSGSRSCGRSIEEGRKRAPMQRIRARLALGGHTTKKGGRYKKTVEQAPPPPASCVERAGPINTGEPKIPSWFQACVLLGGERAWKKQGVAVIIICRESLSLLAFAGAEPRLKLFKRKRGAPSNGPQKSARPCSSSCWCLADVHCTTWAGWVAACFAWYVGV